MVNQQEYAMSVKKQNPEQLFEEATLLAGILNGGRNAYADCIDLIKSDCFSNFDNSIIYEAYGQIFIDNKEFNITNVLIHCNESLGPDTNRDGKIKEVLANQVDNNISIRQLANTLRKKKIIKESTLVHKKCVDALQNMTGTESTAQIFSVSDTALFDLIKLSGSSEDQRPSKLGMKVDALLKHWEENPSINVGIPTPWPKINESIGGGLRSGVHLFGARSGQGKAQPLDSNVLTPSGFKLMGDLRVGDELISPNGGTVKVTHIHPHPQKQIYKIFFKSGFTVECCEDHIWAVEKNRSDYQNYEVLKTTKELIGDTEFPCNHFRRKWKIHTIQPVDFCTNYEYIIPPYTLGALIGDGCITESTTLTSNDPEIVKHIAKELPEYLKIHKRTAKYTYAVINKEKQVNNTFTDEIRKLNLNVTSHHKYIPDTYKYGSIETRKELLRGLFDTDGYASESNIEYSTTSETLAKDVCFIVNSLGGIATHVKRYTKYSGSDKSFPSYRVLVKFNNPSDYFKLTRKKEKALNKTKYKTYFYIDKIEKSRIADAQCITVSSEDGMYITDNFIKTHNSSLGLIQSIFTAENDIPVLFLDTEMEDKDVIPRLLANMAEVEISSIERGIFAQNDFSKNAVNNAANKFRDLPIYYKSIPGLGFDEIMAIIRRWIYSDVGIKLDGKANQCLIVYDYFKIMNSGDLGDVAEFQALGLQINKLTDFCKKYDVPCMSFVQLNRDGIDKESTAVISQSDRLLWACNSFSLFKDKTAEEMEKDGWTNGNKKLITLKSRYGGEHQYGQYISMNMKKNMCILQETNYVTKKDLDI